MRRKLLHIVILVFAVWLSGQTIANVPDTLNLAAIEVKGSLFQKGQMKLQVSNQFIEGFKGKDLAFLLSHSSQIHMKSDGPGGLTTASFRGTSANHTLVLWNETPVNAPNLGSVDFSTIPVFFTDQIGILWGSNSAKHSAGGLGGTVSLNNKARFNSGFAFEAAQQAGSFGSFGSFLSIGYGTKKIHVRSRVFRKSAKNDFPFFNYAVMPQEWMRQQNADFTNQGFLQELHWQTGKRGLLSLISWNQWNNRNLPPIMTNTGRSGQQKEYINDRFHRNVLSYNYFLNRIRIDARIAWSSENQHYFLRTSGGADNNETVTLIDSKNQANALRSSINIEAELGSRLSVFVRFLNEAESVENNNYAETGLRNRYSIIAGGKADAFSWLNASLLLKHEFASNRSGAFLPFFEVQMIPVSSIPLYIITSAGMKLRHPGLNDLYWFPGGNPALNPELSKSADVSFQWNPVTGLLQHQFMFNVYYSQIIDWIQWRPTSYRYWEPVNLALVNARGFELGYQAETKIGSAHLFAGLNYSFTRTTDESRAAQLENTAGKQLIYIPDHHGNLFVRVERKGIFASYVFNYVGKRNVTHASDDLYRNILNHYSLHHISLGYDLTVSKSEWSFEFQIHNVTDTEYQSVMWRPMPGRHYTIGLQYKFR